MVKNFGRRFPGAVLIAVSLSLAGADLSWGRAAVPLTQCGQSVNGDAYLTADLDCTGVPGFGVELVGRSSRLEFRGFAIRNAEGAAIHCRGRCDLIGPGTIEGSQGGAGAVRRLFASDLVVRNNDGAGFYCGNNRNVGEVIAVRSEIEGNRFGVWAQRRVRLVDSVVTANKELGVFVQSSLQKGECTKGAAYLVRSTVIGNVPVPPVSGCFGSGNNDECADIKTCGQSFADELSTCGTSVGALAGTNWGICSSD